MTISPFESERLWKVGDPADVRALRNAWLRTSPAAGVAAIDPGARGALVAVNRLRSNELHLHAMNDGLGPLVASLRETETTVIICESQYVPRPRPNQKAEWLGGQIAAAMKTARSAGTALGYLAARSGAPLHLVWCQPSTWQSWLFDCDNKATREDRARLTMAYAESNIPAFRTVFSNGKDREGAASAFGLLQWWLTCSMMPSR